MNLQEYIQGIEDCPDEFDSSKNWWKLTGEFNVYDNYPMLLNVDYQVLIKNIQNANYSLNGRLVMPLKVGKEVINNFNYNPGTVLIQVFNHIHEGLITDARPKSPRLELHRNRQTSNYNSAIMLHTYQEKKIPNTNHIRALAMGLISILKMVQTESIPIALPKSYGWNYLGKDEK